MLHFKHAKNVRILFTPAVLQMWRYLHHKCDRDNAGTEQFFVQYRLYTVRSSQWITRIQLDEANDRFVLYRTIGSGKLRNQRN